MPLKEEADLKHRITGVDHMDGSVLVTFGDGVEALYQASYLRNHIDSHGNYIVQDLKEDEEAEGHASNP